jgi:GAF domain-containing protein
MKESKTMASVAECLFKLSRAILNGASIDESLDQIYEDFRQWIPYDRIGFAEIVDHGKIARARWYRSNDRVLLRKGYSAPLDGSSLSIVIQRRQPRILNDLPGYLERRPTSRSTELMVQEGIKSSMTCPLIVKGKPIGLLFFSSRDVDTYCQSHVDIMKDIANQLAMLLMASQHTVSPVVIERLEAESKSGLNSSELLLSQLRPGMVLKNSILANGNLLLTGGTRLTAQSISRLDLLHAKGMLDSAYIQIDQNVYPA